MKTLVVIPAYNEEQNIDKVIKNLKDKAPYVDYLIINDCSKDGTEKLCRQQGYKYISLPINLGIGGAVQTGYLYAYKNGYDLAVQFDGDGQHDPAYIKDVIEPIENGEADIVIGSRFINKEGFQSSGSRRIGIKILSLLIKICSGRRNHSRRSHNHTCCSHSRTYHSGDNACICCSRRRYFPYQHR